MNKQLPAFYTSLRPFARLFDSGIPMLIYHKLGPRPRSARLRGLYVARGLFEKQLAELRAAGFSSSTCALPADPSGNPSRRVVLSFDDGFSNVLRHGLEPMARHGFKAIEFLVPGLLGRTNEWDAASGEIREPLMDAALVREWLSAGHEIGSHTITHPFLTRISPARAREEVFASRKMLEDTFAVPIRHFCYPYGDWNPAVRDLVVQAGYETACTTEFGVNTAATHPFELRRITARHRSISLKAISAWLKR